MKRERPIIKNKKAETYYRTAINQELQKLLDKVISEIKKIYTKVDIKNSYTSFKNPKNPTPTTFDRFIKFVKKNWYLIFYLNTDKIIDKFIDVSFKNADNSSKENLEDIGISVKTNRNKFREAIRLIASRNANLIKNTTEQAINDIQNIVSNGMLQEQSFNDIFKQLKHVKNISESRIKRIAYDQTGKLNEAINRINQEQAGIEFFEWWGVDDARERPQHKILNGKIFKWNDKQERLPIIDTKGTRGYPGEAVYCRCQALAYYVDLDKYKPVWLGNNKGYTFINKNNNRK